MRDPRDEIAGFGSGLALAVGLGLVSGTATVIVLVGWLRLAGIAGTFQPDAGGVLMAMQWWLVFWLALSAGLLASLWAGYRGWRILYADRAKATTATREDDMDSVERREALDAIAAAEAIVREARTNTPDR